MWTGTKNLRGLEAEDAKLKRLLAEAVLDHVALKDSLGNVVTPAWRTNGGGSATGACTSCSGGRDTPSTMSRYHFNVTDGHAVSLDIEGSDFAADQAAMAAAYRDVRDMPSSGDKKGLCRRHWRMDAVDQHGAAMFSLPFGHALIADQLRATAP